MAIDIHSTVTAQIIAAIEAGAGAYTMPWHQHAGQRSVALPINAKTGKAYQGINTLMLWAAGDERGYTSNKWATYKQWGELGAQVRKGEKASLIIFWKQTERVDVTTGEARRSMFARGSYGFNAAQVDGYVDLAAPVDAPAELFAAHARAEAMMKASGADIREGGDRAFYVPSLDYIALPDRTRFVGSPTSTPQEAFYATAAHELIHWTGAKTRCDRNLTGRFGSEAYAGEELVAELGAAFMCAHLGIAAEPRHDHAQYVASWLRALKNDTRAIFTAASAASKATQFLLAQMEA